MEGNPDSRYNMNELEDTMLSRRATRRKTKTVGLPVGEAPKPTLTETGSRRAVPRAAGGKRGTNAQWVRDPFTEWKELWTLDAQQRGRTEHHERTLKMARRSRFR